MTFRCYWCDNDSFQGVDEKGEVLDLEIFDSRGIKPKDHICMWCGHLLSDGNPREGDPKETVESLKEERDELRAELEACEGESIELAADKIAHDKASHALHD